jgi:hypothetical protein
VYVESECEWRSKSIGYKSFVWISASAWPNDEGYERNEWERESTKGKRATTNEIKSDEKAKTFFYFSFRLLSLYIDWMFLLTRLLFSLFPSKSILRPFRDFSAHFLPNFFFLFSSDKMHVLPHDLLVSDISFFSLKGKKLSDDCITLKQFIYL